MRLVCRIASWLLLPGVLPCAVAAALGPPASKYGVSAAAGGSWQVEKWLSA